MAFTSSVFSHIPLNNQRVYTLRISINRNYPEPPPPPRSRRNHRRNRWSHPVHHRWRHWPLPHHSQTPSVGGASSRRRQAAEKRRWWVYSNNPGFQRWRKIYGETDDVNREQMDIRHGHSKTVENVLKILKDEGSLVGVSVRGAGCGVGSSAIPLAKEGAVVYASDISAAMVGRG